MCILAPEPCFFTVLGDFAALSLDVLFDFLRTASHETDGFDTIFDISLKYIQYNVEKTQNHEEMIFLYIQHENPFFQKTLTSECKTQ